jgi:amino acid transporter
MSDEDPQERENRELIELLNEVRIVLPGIQVLFAFLLTLPFTGGFSQIDGFESFTYQVAFVASSLAAVMLIAPSAFHRVRFRKGDKEALLEISNRVVLAGLVALGVAIVSAVSLVAELVMSRAVALAVIVAVAVAIVGLWFALPISRALRDRGSSIDAG